MRRLEKLKELEDELYKLMKRANSRSISSIARQYRETLREIEELEGAEEDDDEIATLLEKRSATGKPNTVRKSSAGIRRK